MNSKTVHRLLPKRHTPNGLLPKKNFRYEEMDFYQMDICQTDICQIWTLKTVRTVWSHSYIWIMTSNLFLAVQRGMRNMCSSKTLTNSMFWIALQREQELKVFCFSLKKIVIKSSMAAIVMWGSYNPNCTICHGPSKCS